MSDPFTRTIAEARRYEQPATPADMTLEQSKAVIVSMTRTIAAQDRRIAELEARIAAPVCPPQWFCDGVNEYAERRERTGPPVRDADMAALMGAVEWQAPGRTVNWPGIGLLAACVVSAALVVWLVVGSVEP